MAARSRGEAFRDYGSALQQAIACFTANRFFVRSVAVPIADSFALNLANDDALELRDAHGTVQAALSISLYCREVQLLAPTSGWEIATVAYVYRLTAAEAEGAPEREIVEYHWHPWVADVSFPHLHATDAPARTSRLHFPTGYVTLQDVLTLAMREFGVRANRSDWERPLGEADAVLRTSMEVARSPSTAPSR